MINADQPDDTIIPTGCEDAAGVRHPFTRHAFTPSRPLRRLPPPRRQQARAASHAGAARRAEPRSDGEGVHQGEVQQAGRGLSRHPAPARPAGERRASASRATPRPRSASTSSSRTIACGRSTGRSSKATCNPDADTWEDWVRKLPEESRVERANEGEPGAKLAMLGYRVLTRLDGATLLELAPLDRPDAPAARAGRVAWPPGPRRRGLRQHAVVRPARGIAARPRHRAPRAKPDAGASLHEGRTHLGRGSAGLLASRFSARSDCIHRGRLQRSTLVTSPGSSRCGSSRSRGRRR